MGYHENITQCQNDINSLYHFERIPGNIPGAYARLESEIIRYIKYHVYPKTDKIKIKISVDGSKVSRISNFVVLSFSVITDDLTLSSKDQNVCCIVNCKEEYDHLKLACRPIFQKINTLYEKASIEVEGKHFDLDILMGGDVKYLQLVLGLGGSLCNYSCSWCRVHKNQRDDMTKPLDFLPYSWYAENITEHHIGEKSATARCFKIDQEMDAILLIIGIVYGVCRIVI
jgi:hypothetical protein